MVNAKQRDALLREQVRGFASAGWVAGATATNNGIRWRWYRDGSDYVITGRILTGNKACDDIGDPDINGRFSPEDVRRICGTAAPSATMP